MQRLLWRVLQWRWHVRPECLIQCTAVVISEEAPQRPHQSRALPHTGARHPLQSGSCAAPAASSGKGRR